MGCSTKLIGGVSAATVVFAFVCLILGIIVATSSIPTSSCGDGNSRTTIGVSQSESDDVNQALTWVGMPLIVGGICGLIGGGVGAWSGLKSNKGGLCFESVCSGIGGGVLVIAALCALMYAAIFGTLCGEFVCEASGASCNVFGLANDICFKNGVCCECTSSGGLGVHAACKETVDWACEMGTKKWIATVFACIGAIFAIVASCCGCGAACCCPNSFTEMAQQTDGAAAQGTVIGQPVYGQPIGNAAVVKEVESNEPVQANAVVVQ